jgi:hypothetical protein
VNGKPSSHDEQSALLSTSGVTQRPGSAMSSLSISATGAAPGISAPGDARGICATGDAPRISALGDAPGISAPGVAPGISETGEIYPS